MKDWEAQPHPGKDGVVVTTQSVSAVDPKNWPMVIWGPAQGYALGQSMALAKDKETADLIVTAVNAYHASTGWISVKDRLPENKKLITPYHYLISIQGKDVQEAAWAESCASTKDHPDWDFFDVHHHGERISRSWITHWMPLPAPAKEIR